MKKQPKRLLYSNESEVLDRVQYIDARDDALYDDKEFVDHTLSEYGALGEDLSEYWND